MNILFFLKHKENVEYITSEYTLRQVLEKLDIYGYTALPMLDEEGHYVDTVSEGDVLMHIKNNKELNLFDLENVSIRELKIRRSIKSINITSNMEDLLELTLNQNFVPVVDDLNHFIGIITRQSIINYFLNIE